MSLEVITVKGKVVDTSILYVRENRDLKSNLVVMLQKSAEVYIDPLYVDPEWYKVETQTHCHGWALRKYIAIKE